MSRHRLLAFNALSMLVANIVSKVIILVGMIFMLQYFDAGLESTYYLITAFALVLCVNFQDGMVSMTIRRIATDYDNGPRNLGTLYLASAFLAVVLGLIAIAAAFLYAGTHFETTGAQGEFILSACALSAAYLVGYGYASAGAGFKAYERLYIEAMLIVFHAVLSAVIYIYGAVHQWPLSRFFILILAVTVIHVIISNIVLFTFVVKPKFHLDIRAALRLFRESLGLGLASLLRTMQDRMHPFFITSLAGHQYVTQWSSPSNLFMHFKFIPLSVRPALFPSLARKAQEPTEDFQTYSMALMKSLYLVAIPLLVLVAIARVQILPLVTSMDPTFERTYAMALEVVPFIAWAVALSFPSQVLRSLFVALKRPGFEFRTVFAGVAVLVSLNLMLLREGTIMGAAYAALAAEVTILGYGLWLLHKVGRGLNVVNLFFLPTLCGIITHLLAEFLYRIHWGLGIACVVLVFPILVLGFRVISPTEWGILREVIHPAKSTGG